MAKQSLSVYLSFLLRHKPDALALNMDTHGWVDVQELMEKINRQGRYPITLPILEKIVEEDNKGRYRLSGDKTRIKACQGHTIPWVEPELQERTPPAYLYHGTTEKALGLILESGEISRMKRHAVHMQAQEAKAWISARRWRGEVPVVLKIDAGTMHEQGYSFAVSENEVWFSESVPISYIAEILREDG